MVVMTRELALRRTSSNGHRLLGRRDEGDQVDIQLRTACKACEIAWAVEHCTSEESSGAVFEWPAPRKMVHAEPAHASAYPMHCLHCGDAPCISACPNGAMSRESDSGAVVVNEDRCQGCFMFAVVCPLGAISAHPTKRVAVKCDRCTDREKRGQKGVNSDAGGLGSKRSISLL